MTGVSVVIVTRNRAQVLERALHAVAAQRRQPMELIVVNDGSEDDTAARVNAFAEAAGSPPTRLLSTPHGGIARARNTGWRAAAGDVIAFTDDDCIPSTDWLGNLVAPIEDDRADVVQGRTLPDPSQQHLMSPWSRTLRVESEQGYYQTANIAYRRPCLEQVGGFAPELARVGEDTDLAWRIKKAGFRTTFAQEALVHHAVWPFSYGKHLRDRPKWADVIIVLQRHPELRSLVHRNIWYRPSHRQVVAELTGVALASLLHPTAGGAAAAAVLARRARQAGRWSRAPLRRVAIGLGMLVSDTTETAAFVAGSVRHRTVLL